MEEETMRIYYKDLKKETRERLDKLRERQGWSLETFGNDDIVPIAVLGIEKRKENN